MAFRKKSIRLVFGFFLILIFGVFIGRSEFLDSARFHIYSALKASPKTPRKISTYHQEKKGLFDRLGNRSTEVLFIGDSLIDNGEWQELLPSNNVINRGIQGIATSDLLSLFPQIELIKSPKVFVMIGINDLRRGVTHKVILANYSHIVDQLLKNFEFVFIHSVLFGAYNEKELNLKIMEFNSSLEKLAQNNKRTLFVDLNSRVSPEGYISEKLSFDGIHLNGKGYIVWREAIKILIDKIE